MQHHYKNKLFKLLAFKYDENSFYEIACARQGTNLHSKRVQILLVGHGDIKIFLV